MSKFKITSDGTKSFILKVNVPNIGYRLLMIDIGTVYFQKRLSVYTWMLKPRPSHLLGSLVSQLGGDMSECFTIGSSLLTGRQDGAVRFTETGSGQRSA